MEPQVTHEVITTPFQVAMDCKHVAEDADHICWNCTIKIIDMAEAAEAALQAVMTRYASNNETMLKAAQTISDLRDERDTLRRQLAEAQAKIAQYDQQLDVTAWIGWIDSDWESETPLGQALDGLGDEVE